MEAQIEELKKKGNARFEAGDNAGASAFYTEALGLCGDENEHRDLRRVLHSNRSAARLKAGDADGALKDADRCLELGPGWSRGLARRAGALAALRRFDEACKTYEQALFGDPNNQSLKDGLEKAKAALAGKDEAKNSGSAEASTESKTAEDDPLASFFNEVAELQNASKAKVTQVDHETETAGWTSASQIERILQKHHKYYNLNPYHVFGIAHHANDEDFKKRYHKLSALVHPDKNGNDPRAREAFEFVKKAYEELKNEDRRKLLLDTFDVCRKNVEIQRAESLKALGNREDLLIEREGTFEFAFDREIKKTLALNEENRIKAEKLRAANEEAIARSQMAKQTNWGEFKREQDAVKEGTETRTKNWAEFRANKRQKS